MQKRTFLYHSTTRVQPFWMLERKLLPCVTITSICRTIIVRLAVTTMATKLKNRWTLRSPKTRLLAVTHQVRSTWSTRARCQCCRLTSHSSLWLQGRRGVVKTRKKQTRNLAWISQARDLLKGRRKLWQIANTTIETFTLKVCAKIVTISKAAQSLRVAVLTKNCTLRNSARTATWSTTAKRREKRIGMLKLQHGRWLSHFPPKGNHLRRIHQRSQSLSVNQCIQCPAVEIACRAIRRRLLWQKVAWRRQGKWNLQKLQSNFQAKIRSQATVAFRFKRIRWLKMS